MGSEEFERKTGLPFYNNKFIIKQNCITAEELYHHNIEA